ncbi:MAG: DUF2715 domain-containing protein [Treponema sp.]
MKKIIGLLLFLMIPTLIFSEVVFVPRIGFDVHKGIQSQMFDNMLVNWINKALESGKAPNESVTHIKTGDLPHSKPLITMITLGLDMQFISHGNGFTFFWNNEFSYAAGFQAYEKFTFLRKFTPANTTSEDKISKEDQTTYQKQKIMMISTELLFGGTFRRESAFNINFGLGFRTSITPQTLTLISGLLRQQFPKDNTVIAILPAIGGTFGVTYYFNEIVGISASVSDFISFGTFIAGKVDVANSKITRADAFASLGLSNSFAMKLGVSLRINGVRN